MISKKVRNLFCIVGLTIPALISCARQPILDTPFEPGEIEVLLDIEESKERTGRATYNVTFGKESRGGVTTLMRGYEPEDPSYGFIIPRRTGGLLKNYIVRDNGEDHRLQLGDLTRVTADVKFEILLDREAPDLQVAQMLLDTQPARTGQIGGAQLFRLNLSQAFNLACDDEMSAAVRRLVADIESFPNFRSMWSDVTETGMSTLDNQVTEAVNLALEGSSNCGFRVANVRVSNIAPDEATQDALAKAAQTKQRLDAVRSLLEEYRALGATPSEIEFVQGLILQGGGSGDVHVHLGEGNQ